MQAGRSRLPEDKEQVARAYGQSGRVPPDGAGGRLSGGPRLRCHDRRVAHVLADWLRSFAVTVAAMESTGVHWRTVFHFAALNHS